MKCLNQVFFLKEPGGVRTTLRVNSPRNTRRLKSSHMLVSVSARLHGGAHVTARPPSLPRRGAGTGGWSGICGRTCRPPGLTAPITCNAGDQPAGPRAPSHGAEPRGEAAAGSQGGRPGGIQEEPSVNLESAVKLQLEPGSRFDLRKIQR